MILFVTGEQGSGKSTLVDEVAAIAPQQSAVLHIGEALRAKYGAEFMTCKECATAPKELQGEVQELISEFVEDQGDAGYLFIETSPRRPEMVDWVLGRWPFAVLAHIMAPRDVRRARLADRDGRNPEAVRLLDVRFHEEAELALIPKVKARAQELDMPVIPILNSVAEVGSEAYKLRIAAPLLAMLQGYRYGMVNTLKVAAMLGERADAC